MLFSSPFKLNKCRNKFLLMEEKNIEILLNIFANGLENKTYEQDNNKIMYVCNLLKDMEQKLPTLEEIEKAKEHVTDLEIKYEEFYEIANYFDPIYFNIEKALHKIEVEKNREENRRKREVK